MTPGEMKLLREMLRDEIDQALKPVHAKVDPLVERIKKLEDTDKRHDRTFAPRATLNDAKQASEDAMTAAGMHMDRVVTSVDKLRASMTAELVSVNDGLEELRDAVTNLEKQNKVKVTDENGIVSIVPAATVAAKQSTVAAQAAASSEGKLTAIAVDASIGKQDAATAKRWAKYGPLITVFTTIAYAIYQGIQQAAHH